VPLFRSPHLQTIGGHFWPRPSTKSCEQRLYRTEPDVQVQVETERPAGTPRGNLVLVHGLEGSSRSGYMRSLSHAAAMAGYTAHRFNLRSCGGSERLTKTGYHGGQTGDLLFVVRALAAESGAPVWMIGFSLGGNIVTKLAGELGEDARGLIAGMCGVSAAIDLHACARRIGQPDNRLYQARFVQMMRARARTVWHATPADLRGIRTLFELDDRITAPAFGFGNAVNYYETQSAKPWLDRIRVPALFLTSQDDIFIPFSIYSHPAFRSNPFLRLMATQYGGHVGFLAATRPYLWLDHAIMEWITHAN